jgi:spore germination protein (amino acid permease)
MNQEKISPYQFSTIIMGFILGSSIAANATTIAKQDSWLSFLLGWGAGFVLLFITLGIGLLHPNKTLVGILIDCFGKKAGKIISLVFILYLIMLSALSVKVFGFYSITTNYPETPILFFIICVTLVAAFCIRTGIETLGRISEIFICITALNIFVSFPLLIARIKPDHLKPFLENGLTPVILSGFGTAMIPFSEIFLCLMLFPSLNNSRNLVKSSVIAIFVPGFLLFTAILRNITVLGADFASRVSYPSFIVFKLTQFPFSVESLFDTNVALTIVIKIGLCIYAASKAIAEVFDLKEYKILIFPLSALIAPLSYFLQKSIMEQTYVATHIIPFVDVPLFVAFPLLVLVISLFKTNSGSA